MAILDQGVVNKMETRCDEVMKLYEKLKGVITIPMEDYHVTLIMDAKFKEKKPNKSTDNTIKDFARRLRSLGVNSVTITDLKR